MLIEKHGFLGDGFGVAKLSTRLQNPRPDLGLPVAIARSANRRDLPISTRYTKRVSSQYSNPDGFANPKSKVCNSRKLQ